MSLVVCLKSSDGIVLAADSRGTIGDPRGLTAINDTQIKIFPLGACGLGLVGASEMGATLLDEYKKKGIDKATNIEEAVTQAVDLGAQLFSGWFGQIKHENRPLIALTIAGYRKAKDAKPEAMIYMLTSQTNFAPQLFGPSCLSGVPQYAVYLQHRLYDSSISLEKAEALAAYLISETASQDPKVGGPIKMAEIKPETGYRELSIDEVVAICKKNEALNQQLREFFLKGDKK